MIMFELLRHRVMQDSESCCRCRDLPAYTKEREHRVQELLVKFQENELARRHAAIT